LESEEADGAVAEHEAAAALVVRRALQADAAAGAALHRAAVDQSGTLAVLEIEGDEKLLLRQALGRERDARRRDRLMSGLDHHRPARGVLELDPTLFDF